MQTPFSTADNTVIAVERAMQELRAGRPVWVENQLIQAAESSPQTLSAAAIRLLKHAHLLPQGVHLTAEENTPWLHVSSAQINGYHEALAESLMEVSAAKMPTHYAENTRIKIFRPRYGLIEHVAVLVGSPETQDAPLVRVHSSCLTGDLLGSLRCDCGDQLHLALHTIAAQGHGVLCYLHQEGRGIGLGNKIRAYALQEAGEDTLTANESLGFAADERHFGVASAMLKLLGISQINLLTNNPKKVEDLADFGIAIASRTPLKATPHAHNADYLATKAAKLRHQL